MEKRRRSIIKAFSWRVTATFTTGLIAYFVTGELDFAFKIGAIELVAKMILYYFHERLWAQIKYGFIKLTDYQI